MNASDLCTELQEELEKLRLKCIGNNNEKGASQVKKLMDSINEKYEDSLYEDALFNDDDSLYEDALSNLSNDDNDNDDDDGGGGGGGVDEAGRKFRKLKPPCPNSPLTAAQGEATKQASYYDWDVAVKVTSSKDIGADFYIALDGRDNIVQLYTVEKNDHFQYLAFDLGLKSLSDYIKDLLPRGLTKEMMLKFSRDIVRGVYQIHLASITHGNLTPENIIIFDGDKAKITGFGEKSKIQSSNEEAQHDLIELGLLIYYCLFMSDDYSGIVSYLQGGNSLVTVPMEGGKSGKLEEINPELHHLLTGIRNRDLSARQILEHPIYWEKQTWLNFIKQTSDKLEKQPTSLIVRQLDHNTCAPINWGRQIDQRVKSHLEHHSKYMFTHISHLIRALRNIFAHASDYAQIQVIKRLYLKDVSTEEQCLKYFFPIFRDLLMRTYIVMNQHCRQDHDFQEFFI